MADDPEPEWAELQHVSKSLDLSGLFPTYRHFNFLLGTARSLVDRQPEAAIAVAQMAFESFVAFAFERLFQLHGIAPPLSERLSALVTGSLMEPPTRTLWAELTGHKVNSAPESAWRNYQDHVTRRNEMVHAGGRASAAEATESVDAVAALMTAMIEMARSKEQQLKGGSPIAD